LARLQEREIEALVAGRTLPIDLATNRDLRQLASANQGKANIACQFLPHIDRQSGSQTWRVSETPGGSHVRPPITTSKPA